MDYVADVRPIELSIGVAGITNDPLSRTAELRVGGAWRRDRFGVWLDGGAFVHHHDALARYLINDTFADPDIVGRSAEAAAGVEFVPLDGAIERWGGTFALGVRFGFGAVRTVDDLVALHCFGIARCEDTKVQVHPDTVFGARLTFAPCPSWALTVTGDSRAWVETIESERLVMKDDFLLGAEVGFRFGA